MMEHRVILYCGKDEAARFQYAIHAHFAARALSGGSDDVWKIVDTRFKDEGLPTPRYYNGEYINDVSGHGDIGADEAGADAAVGIEGDASGIGVPQLEQHAGGKGEG
jgi:hypothetical protein